jgi:hypothetical protein
MHTVTVTHTTYGVAFQKPTLYLGAVTVTQTFLERNRISKNARYFIITCRQ